METKKKVITFYARGINGKKRAIKFYVRVKGERGVSRKVAKKPKNKMTDTKLRLARPKHFWTEDKKTAVLGYSEKSITTEHKRLADKLRQISTRLELLNKKTPNLFDVIWDIAEDIDLVVERLEQ